uniref:C2 domain-containing protein n=1 Tax=Steinernema glaseri TaxID=37863 RepID=A0A1I8AHD9_9BILA
MSVLPPSISEVFSIVPHASTRHLPQGSGSLGSIQFSLRYVSEEKKLVVHLIRAKLVVHLIRAKCLKAMDKNGFSDPYVKLHLIPGVAKATKMTSKTVEKTLNPEWNEELVYYGVTEEDKQRKTLRLTVYDRDRIGSDFLGETRYQLKRLQNNQVLLLNRYLEGALPVPHEKNEDEERGKILVGVSYNVQQGSLFIHVKRAAELIGMDSTGFSDPYCKVSLTPLSSKLHKQKTSIKKRTLNPEWNETIKFIVPYKDLPKKTLQINVLDHDVAKQDDYIGGLILSTAAKGDRAKQWQQVIENPGQTFEFWHKLELDH